MTKRNEASFLPSLILMLLVSVLVTSCSPPEKRPDPEATAANVVLIVVDALRPDHLSFNGYHSKTSPYFDSIAARGLYFARAYSQESYTQASTPSLFISRYPTEHRVFHDNPRIDILEEPYTTLAEVLGEYGFSTAAFVFNPHLNAEYNFDQGFDVYDDNKEGFVATETTKKYETASKIRRKSLEWLGSLEEEAPFFLYLHYRDVHGPYDPPEEYVDRKALRALKKSGDRTGRTVLKYDGEIAYTDDQLKILVEEIARLRPGTLFIVTADHGEEFWEHGFRTHGRSLYEPGIRIPLLFYLPRRDFSQVIHRPVESIDIAPTILNMVGVPVPEEFRGLNLLDVARDPGMAREFVFSGGAKGRAVLIRGDMKYYRYRDIDKKLIMSSGRDYAELPFVEELYDLSRDPGETVNLIETEKDLAGIFRKEVDRYFGLQGEGRPGTVTPDEETIRRLKALGYL